MLPALFIGHLAGLLVLSAAYYLYREMQKHHLSKAEHFLLGVLIAAYVIIGVSAGFLIPILAWLY